MPLFSLLFREAPWQGWCSLNLVTVYQCDHGGWWKLRRVISGGIVATFNVSDWFISEGSKLVLSGPPFISQREIFPEKLLLLFALSACMQYPLFEDHPSQRDVNVTFLPAVPLPLKFPLSQGCLKRDTVNCLSNYLLLKGSSCEAGWERENRFNLHSFLFF